MSKLTISTLDLEKEFEHFYQIEKLILRLIDTSEEYKYLKTNTRAIADLYIRILEMYPNKSEFNFLAIKNNNLEEDKRNLEEDKRHLEEDKRNLEEDKRNLYAENNEIKNSRIWRYSALFRKIVDQMKLKKIFSILKNSRKK